MMTLLAALALLQAVPGQEEYQFERERHEFKLAGLLVAAEAIRTGFDEDLRLEDAWGFTVEAHLRLGEIYYYRFAGTWWDAEDDFPSSGDVEAETYTAGLGMDWTFGAFRNFSFDLGGGVGLMRLRDDADKETGFLFQLEAAARLRLAPHVGLCLTGMADFANLHFRTAETRHMTNLSVGAGVEVSF